MIYSHTIGYIAIRISLAAVFLWFGIDKFIHPEYWITAWIPQWINTALNTFQISESRFMQVFAIFEILIGLSFVLDVFTKTFAVLAIIFLLVLSFSFGLGEIFIRDIGLIGATIALLFWPRKKPSPFSHL